MNDLRSILKNASLKLSSSSDSPYTDASEIAMHVFSLTRNELLLCSSEIVDEEKLPLFESLTEKRAGGYPLQYILGRWDFCKKSFFVNEGVLIPRCETEQIVYEASKFLKNKKNAVVFDLCSGSGCIGLSVAADNPNVTVLLFDISPKALECSKRNKEKLSVPNAEIYNYDILKGFDAKLFPFPDVILSNPPYVTKEEYECLQKEIFYEPREAIVADDNGLKFYKAICKKWLPYIKKDGFFMLESGEGQPEQILKMLEPCFKGEAEADIFGTERFIKGFT